MKFIECEVYKPIGESAHTLFNVDHIVSIQMGNKDQSILLLQNGERIVLNGNYEDIMRQMKGLMK